MKVRQPLSAGAKYEMADILPSDKLGIVHHRKHTLLLSPKVHHWHE